MAAIIYLCYDICINFVWEQKTNIIGSVFLGLSIYSYFYRVLDDKEKKLNQVIIKANNLNRKIKNMTTKSDVQTILDSVAAFNNSINSFKDNIIMTFKAEMKELEDRIMNRFDEENKRTKEDIKKIEVDVESIKKSAATEKTLVRVQKNKLGWIVSISVFFTSVILGLLQYFILRAIG